MHQTLFALAAAMAATMANAEPHRHDAIECASCEGWNQPQAPFKVVGNTWYVGTRELSALLVTTPKGHILLDGALPQSAAQIRANIESLGFRMSDVRYILNSHAHWDHAGGIAALQEASGATVLASQSGVEVMKAGTIGADDPQFDAANPVRMPRVSRLQAVRDQEKLALGGTTITAHMTPGHTPGSTTWSWQSCDAGKCYDVVYADSLTAVSLGDFRYTGGNGRPDVSGAFRASIDRVAALRCDVVVSTHPGFTDTQRKLAATTPSHNAFIDPEGCVRYAAGARERLEKRIAAEQAR